MSSLEIEGKFWLPQTRDTKVAGTLSFDPEDGGELVLIGTLNVDDHDPSRIIGLGRDGLYTLEGCFLRQETHGTLSRQAFYVNRVFAGVEYEVGDKPSFDEFRMGVTNLTEWVNPPRIFEDIGFGVGSDGRQQTYTISIAPLDDQTVQTTAGTVSLIQARGFDGDGLRSRRLTQEMSFRFQGEQTHPVAEITDIASDLRDLVSIGTDETAAFNYLHLYTDGIEGQEPAQRQPVRLIAAWHAKPGKEQRHPFQMAFTFDDLGGLEGVKRWLDAAEVHRSGLSRVMNTRYVPMFADDKLLHRVAALERLHEVWKGPSSTVLVKRLEELSALAGDPISSVLPDVAAWCEKAKNERHNVAHHAGRVIHQDAADLMYSGEIAYWIFVLCLLRLADAPQAVFDHIATTPSISWLRSVFGTA
jgi:ApeA-like protein